MGHFNGQGLGAAVRRFVSEGFVTDGTSVQRGVQMEGATVPITPCAQNTCNARVCSSVVGDIQVLVRVTPGVEYIKVRDFAFITISRVFTGYRQDWLRQT